jgi:hypothetical protein
MPTTIAVEAGHDGAEIVAEGVGVGVRGCECDGVDHGRASESSVEGRGRIEAR